jgi:uncharacterized membrane protein (DUF2068 family)
MPAYRSAGFYGFRVIGTLKLLSGLIALVVGLGTSRFLRHDPGPKLERVVTHLGLDPQNRFIHDLISHVTGIDPTHLRALEVGTFFYALLHLIEGIGLILERDWAGYLVVIATSSLVPFELYEMKQKFTPVRFAFFVLNVGIVIYLIGVLRKERRERLRHAH